MRIFNGFFEGRNGILVPFPEIHLSTVPVEEHRGKITVLGLLHLVAAPVEIIQPFRLLAKLKFLTHSPSQIVSLRLSKMRTMPQKESAGSIELLRRKVIVIGIVLSPDIHKTPGRPFAAISFPIP